MIKANLKLISDELINTYYINYTRERIGIKIVTDFGDLVSIFKSRYNSKLVICVFHIGLRYLNNILNLIAPSLSISVTKGNK